MNPNENGLVNIDSAESLIEAQGALPPDERDVEELNSMIKTLRETGIDAPNVRAAIAKLIALREEKMGIK